MTTLFAALLLALFGSQPPTPAPPEPRQAEQQQATESAESPAVQDEPPDEVSAFPENQLDGDGQGDEPDCDTRCHHNSTSNWWLGLADLALTAALVGVTIALVRVGRRQWQGLHATQQLTALVERPWVNPWTLHLTPFEPGSSQHKSAKGGTGCFGSHKAITVVLGLKNSGGTPAFIESVEIGYKIDKNVTALDEAELTAGISIPKVLVKGEETNWRYNLIPEGLSDEMHRQLVGVGLTDSDNRLMLVIYGRITYRQGNRETGDLRWTKFSRMFDRTVEKDRWGGRFAFTNIPGWNDAT